MNVYLRVYNGDAYSQYKFKSLQDCLTWLIDNDYMYVDSSWEIKSKAELDIENNYDFPDEE